MSNVLIEKNKLDILANAISNKSGEPLTLTLDEMVEAVDGIEQGIQPSGNVNITHAGQTDVTNYATATVPNLSTYAEGVGYYYTTENGQRKWKANAYFRETAGVGGFIEAYSNYESEYQNFNAIPKNTSVTPTESAQTIGGANTMMEGAVTVNAIPSEYIIPTGNKAITSYGNNIDVAQYATASVPRATVTVGTTIIGTNANIASNTSNNTLTLSKSSTNVRVDSDGGFFEQGSRTVSSDVQLTASCNINNSDSLTVSGATVTAPSGYYSASASKSVASGTAGIPTATKGTVSNHSVSVTPSVTNTTGYITGSTKTGTAVTVSASELVSGSETKTANGTYDVTNLASIVVNIPFSTIYTGSGNPSSATGTNGDIYLKVVN